MMTTWSYSALTAFETCPLRYYLTRVTKEVTEPPTEATIWGNRVHKALEDRIKSGSPMPEGMEKWGKIVDKVVGRSTGGEMFTELKLTVNKSFKPTGWSASDAWCRGIVDAGIVKQGKIVAVDWKTGKRRPDSDQLKLFAVLLFAHNPDVQNIATGFVWLGERKIDKQMFTREDASGIWNEFLPRVRRIDEAFEADRWAPRPSGLCKSWCPVGKSLCKFCGR